MPERSSQRENIFNQLYSLTRDPVFHYIRHYTDDTQLIEDLMQEAYLKVWDRLDSIRDIDRALPLVKTYTRNLLIDVVRRRMKEDVQWLESLNEEVSTLVESSLSVENKRQLEILDIAIERLPDKCKTVYLYHREDGLSYKEIAARLSVSVSMVEKHMSKAIRLLKQEILNDPSLVFLLVVAGGLL